MTQIGRMGADFLFCGEVSLAAMESLVEAIDGRMSEYLALPVDVDGAE